MIVVFTSKASKETHDDYNLSSPYFASLTKF